MIVMNVAQRPYICHASAKTSQQQL
jgi:hypothetical protein